MEITSKMVEAAMLAFTGENGCQPPEVIMRKTLEAALAASDANFIHKLETGEADKQPNADEELVAFLGMAAEAFDFISKTKVATDDLRIGMTCRRALEMAARLGNEHRTMFIPYATMVKNLFKEMDTPAGSLMHAGVGVAGEGGELADWCKKHWVYNKPLDEIVKKENGQTLLQCIMEELGDSHFYQQAILNMFGWTWHDVRMANRIKLAKRYPDGVYTDAHANARLDKEGDHNG